MNIYLLCVSSIVLVVFIDILSLTKLTISKEEKIVLSILSITIVFESIIDPLLFRYDGREGVYYFLKIFNGIQYLLISFLAYTWVIFLIVHMITNYKKRHILIAGIPFFIGIILMIINVFVPFIFKIDETSTYVRLSGYYIYFAIDLFYVISSLITYLILKRNDISLNIFPVYLFFIPVVVGSIFQTVYEKTSSIIPFCAIAYACLHISLQNEIRYKDTLTNIYNRAFLTFYISKSNHLTMLTFIDLNNFKSINDNFGHKTGDEALKTFTKVLSECLNTNGYLIRYAGDEFVIIFKTLNEEKNLKLITLSQQKLKVISDSLPYEISFSYGYGIYSPDDPFDEFLSKTDKKLYENKKEFYKNKD